MSTEAIAVPGQVLINRLESVIEALPKEGYKAAVAVGVVDRILTLVNEIRDLAGKIECVAKHKGKCRESFCNPECGGLFVEKSGGSLIIAKYASNPFSAKFESGRLEVGVKNARLILEGSSVRVGVLGRDGYVWEEVDLSNEDELFEKNYTVKYVLRKVGKPIILARTAIRYCMTLSAITC